MNEPNTCLVKIPKLHLTIPPVDINLIIVVIPAGILLDHTIWEETCLLDAETILNAVMGFLDSLAGGWLEEHSK